MVRIKFSLLVKLTFVLFFLFVLLPLMYRIFGNNNSGANSDYYEVDIPHKENRNENVNEKINENRVPERFNKERDISQQNLVKFNF